MLSALWLMAQGYLPITLLRALKTLSNYLAIRLWMYEKVVLIIIGPLAGSGRPKEDKMVLMHLRLCLAELTRSNNNLSVATKPELDIADLWDQCLGDKGWEYLSLTHELWLGILYGSQAQNLKSI